MRADYHGIMTAPIEGDLTADKSMPKRIRKPRNRLQQRLTAAKRQLQLAQEAHAKALAQLEQQTTAELARRGRQIYVSTVEGMHPGERALVVQQVMASVEPSDLVAVQTWLDSLENA